MENNVTYAFNQKELKKQVREYRFKKKIKNVKKNITEFLDENKDTIKDIALPIIVTGAATGVTKIPKTISKLKSEKNKHSYYGWDLKRDLTNYERKDVQRRRANGEMLGDIFEEMKILK